MNHSETLPTTLYLWPQRTLFLGHIGPLAPLNIGAHTLLVGVDHPIPVTVGERTISSDLLLIPAGTCFTASSKGGRIGCCFLDPMGRDFRFHRNRMREEMGGLYVARHEGNPQHQILAQLHDEQASAAEAYARLEGSLFPASEERVVDFRSDERIEEVIFRIRSDPSDNVSNQTLADAVGLSGDRLQRLFKEVTGVPIRRYRLWHRLFVTSSMMALGSSLTDAALAAGFSDSSHLTHVFKSMLGMSPSTVLRRSQQIRILVGQGEGFT